MIEVTVGWFTFNILPFFVYLLESKIVIAFLHDYVYLPTICIHLFSGVEVS